MIDPFEQPDSETSREGDHDAASCRRRDCADCIIAALDAADDASFAEPDDTAPEPCTRRGCRGCEKSPPVADLGNEAPF